MLLVRLEFTMEQFFSKGGVTTFTDRMAAVLGIHRADLKVVTLYEGSTIVEFVAMSDPEAEDDAVDLGLVAAVFEQFVSSGATFMDTAVLGAMVEGSLVYGEPFAARERESESSDIIA